MAKNTTRTAYFCKNCGNESPKWVGRCPACGEWNTLIEEPIAPKTASHSVKYGAHDGKRDVPVVPVKISQIKAEELSRIKLPSAELNRVLGGGLVPGSLILIGGEPGVGKSTLVLQNVLRIRSRRVLYVSGEESQQQLRMRANRIAGSEMDCECYLLCETSLENIFASLRADKPDLVIVDSIQTIASDDLDSAPGRVSQVRECAAAFLRFAKETNTPVILIGHINKEGSIAGPKVLEHIVDAVVQFEGDRNYMYRILRSIKNRFGNTNEIGIYEMKEDGLREVANPSEMLLSQSDESLSGAAIGVTVDGARPFLIEVQALVSTAAYGTAQRSVTGFDPRRMNMLLAVLEKRIGFKLAQKDVFLNIAGGLKVNDPALDLAVVCAILSSNVDMPINHGVCFSGEVGLSGEIRQVTRIEQRIGEAQKLGFDTIVIPRNNLKGVRREGLKIKLVEVARVEEAFSHLFG
ncbi:MAG: DNA repair protein RadA [Muribaculaceae bacterium]|nr:DNA repair protein RadA [Muribaculaceae bacterium]